MSDAARSSAGFGCVVAPRRHSKRSEEPPECTALSQNARASLAHCNARLGCQQAAKPRADLGSEKPRAALAAVQIWAPSQDLAMCERSAHMLKSRTVHSTPSSGARTDGPLTRVSGPSVLSLPDLTSDDTRGCVGVRGVTGLLAARGSPQRHDARVTSERSVRVASARVRATRGTQNQQMPEGHLNAAPRFSRVRAAGYRERRDAPTSSAPVSCWRSELTNFVGCAVSAPPTLPSVWRRWGRLMMFSA